MADLLSAPDEGDALEDLHSRGCTDGLPVVIPTRQRVERMVLASGQDPEMVLGTMGPGHGIASIEKVAVAAVMAGCLPDYMPVVVAAVRAVIEPEFDLTEMQATTHCTAPLVLVNGPARHSCGPIASGTGALGPGHRANASIGRALRLTMINIGKARPGSSDMALLGHPGKFTYCLAEDEENSPFPPLHVDLGFDPDDSVVTVLGAEAPHSVLYAGDGDDPNGYRVLLDLLAMGFGHALPVGQAGLGRVAPDGLKAYGGDPLGLWGETDPDELLHWWLRIAADRETWRRLGRDHAAAVRSLSWRESMRKLLLLLEEFQSM